MLSNDERDLIVRLTADLVEAGLPLKDALSAVIVDAYNKGNKDNSSAQAVVDLVSGRERAVWLEYNADLPIFSKDSDVVKRDLTAWNALYRTILAIEQTFGLTPTQD